ncbi:MAG TPA: hypothetical protein VNI83_06500 [Vicinamibacterales bacterium]|nr:hypothetical protein [Vicinamibacterales bacterium]
MTLSASAAFAGALVLALACTPIVRALAHRYGLVAPPRDDRWHRRPTPLLGGVAIFVAFGGVGLATGAFAAIWPLVGVAAYMFAVGLVDDLAGTRPATKLALQIAGGAALAAFGYRLELFDSLTIDLLLTVLWIVGITNAFNLLDNMDGLAAGIALLSGLALLALALRDGAPSAPLLAAFCGALAGFLVYNFNPASIFMGDSGSLFIGFLLAGVSLVRPAHPEPHLLSILAGPVLLLLVPILDTAFVAICRTLAGRRISTGGRDHTSHRLVALGLSERRAVLMLYVIAAGGGLIAVAMPYAGAAAVTVALTLYLLAVLLLLVYLGGVRVYPEDALASPRGRALTPLLLELTHRRRIFEVLLDFGLAASAYYAAYRIRFEGPEFTAYFPVFLKSLPIVVACRVLALLAMGAYRGVWRYFGLSDLGTFVKAVALGSLASIVIIVYLFRFEDFSRGVFIIDAVLFGVLVVGSRISFRLLADHITRRRRHGRRVVIYGAGDGGALVVRELRNNASIGLRPVGFIDDDPMKRGKRILGLRVLGGREALRELLSEGQVDEVVVSTTKIPFDTLQDIAGLCETYQVPLLRMRLALDRVAAPRSAVH